jgi:UDP-3-O-[3-hydroxymyristoyl] N-acetylglucosamine deacetylase/3-hydroxyacyl-[acyl-carrier-protein] dehydratase
MNLPTGFIKQFCIMSHFQKTLKSEVSASGVSLHSGQEVCIRLLPAPEGHGIVFKRTDLGEDFSIPAHVSYAGEFVRNTTLRCDQGQVSTVEHVLSALRGLGVDNALVILNGDEPPIFDGSARRYVEMIESVGLVDQSVPRSCFRLDRTVTVSDGDRMLIASPGEGLRISCTFADEKGRYTQYLSVLIEPDFYARSIAPARTFTFYEDIEGLLKQGKIKGGSLDSAIVLRDDTVLSREPLRFPDELVRHKILDLVGDLALAGPFIHAHIVAVKPGHAINCKLAQAIAASMQEIKTDSTSVPPQACESSEGSSSMDIQTVMRLLPHRYPFLLIDRVLSVDGNQITAIKNVTINEPHFNGHFPGKPVMPGVLQLEAMAQAAGILFLRMVNDGPKLALFMSAEKVKFRKVVTPGDQLVIKAELVKTRGAKLGIASASISVNGSVVSSAELTFAIVDDV